MRKTTSNNSTLEEPRPRSGNILNPLVALLANHDEKAAADFQDVFDDVACDWRLVWVADGGAAARYVMNKGLPELLITCPNLPQTSGPDLVQWMRSFRCAQPIPVLVYGQAPDGAAREQFLQNDVKLIVPETCSRQTLAAHLTQLVGMVEKRRFSVFA